MSDLTIRTRPHVDIPLAIIALGLALLLAVTTRGALAEHPTVAPTVAPTVTIAPAAQPAQAAPPKDKGKGHD